MNNIAKSLCLSALLACSLASCSSDYDLATDDVQTEVTFNAAATSRATGINWSAGDHIGVCMVATGTGTSASALTGTTANVDYVTTSGNGYFTAASTSLAYPKDGSKVDFVAYYPYSASTTNGVVSVNVADQSNPEAIDLMYSNNAKGLTRTSGTASLTFTHQLAKFDLNITSADGAALDGLQVALKNIPTTASFDLATASFSNISSTADVSMKVSGTGTKVNASAYVLPATAQNVTLVFTTAKGKSFTYTVSKSMELEKGRSYSLNVSVKNSGVEDAEEVKYTSWTETPVITSDQLANEDLHYITHYFTNNSKQVRNYSMLYDSKLKMAYWVAYPLCNYYTKRGTSRTNEWGYDPDISTSLQANLTKGVVGYDRGHQIPSADRLVTDEANIQTFYFTNMTPQVGELNQNIWATLENQVRSWSSNIDTLYVVTGAMPYAQGSTTVNYTYDSDRQRIAVPAYYFKALARIDRETGTAYTIAFRFNNASYSGTIMSAALSVSELESLTGFTFFPNIDAKYKQSYDASKWQVD